MAGAAQEGEVRFRPMREEDLEAAEQLSSAAFLAVDVATARRGEPDPQPRSAARSRAWVARTRHLLGTDAEGCWVAEDPSGLVGVATSLRRELVWCLATYAVRPGLQGRGIGTPLLTAALHHGRGALRGMITSSSDPRAVRRYHAAGFTLHPQLHLAGRVDRSAIPVVEKVREGSAGDREMMDSVDRRTRGGAHGRDHEYLLGTCRLLVSDTTTGSGYAYLEPDGRVALLAATNRRTATRLLWTALADGPPEARVPHLTAANDWAVDVGLAARLDLHQEGFLALRGMKPPAPYVHHGALL